MSMYSRPAAVLLMGALSAAACVQPARVSTPPPSAQDPALRSATPRPAKEPAAAPQVDVQPVQVEERPSAPVVVAWRVVRESAQSVALVARIESRAPVGVPIAVSVHVPPGVQIARGAPRYTVGPAAPPGVHETEFEFAFAQKPKEDIVLLAEAQTPAFGFHAKAFYRFGRAEPVIERPSVTGPHLRVGERDFGPSTPADESPAPHR